MAEAEPNAILDREPIEAPTANLIESTATVYPTQEEPTLVERTSLPPDEKVHEPPQITEAETSEGEGPDAAAAATSAKKKKSEPRIVIPFTSEDIDELIKQGFTFIEKECEKEVYDNGKVKVWKTIVEDYIVKKIIGLEKPFKYTIYVSVSQQSGDGLDMTMGGFFQPDVDGYTTGHWENDDVQADVAVMAFSVQ